MVRHRNLRHRTQIVACLAVAAGLASGVALARPENAGLYLYQIPSSRTHGEPGAPAGAVLVDLYVRDPGHLVEQLAANSDLAVVASTDRYVRVSVSDGDTLTGDPAGDHLAATFVIDYKQQSVTDLVETVYAEYGPQPSIDALVNFVDSAISSKSYRRAFELASQVAGGREGDCTEHAVLLTALARAAKKPARVVLGIMLLEHDGNLASFGHAWTEIHDGQKWQIADATRPGLQIPDARIRYLPLLSLNNEGPGYAMRLMELALIQPARIEVIQNSPSADKTAM